jgi:hypothetical protein
MQIAPSELLRPDQPWLRGLGTSSLGIVTGGGGRFGLGAVLLLEEPGTGRIVSVLKAPRRGYELSARLALPGGMVRGRLEDGPLEAAIAASLSRRVLAEAGYALPATTILRALPILPPPTTSYTAVGVVQRTVVLAFTAPAPPSGFRPVTADPSVSQAAWVLPLREWARWAPATRLILGHWLWARMTRREREAARSGLEEAARRCSSWSQGALLPPAPLPW